MSSFLNSLLLFVIWMITYTNSQTITTSLGDITGTSYGIYSVFAGIPYTENPPTEINRFSPSEMRTSSYSTNPYNATQFGSVCLQPGPLGNEDCLSLNIWTPNINGNYSVMVWIHGGSFTTGSGYLNGVYDGFNFVQKDIVFISINYRLGLLGFLSLNEIYLETLTTNGGLMGIYDQIIALQWINTYISEFGGNSNEITIFGESAGGLSVCALLFSPIATGLFNKVVIQSGACNGPWGFAPKIYGENRNIYYMNTVYELGTNLTYLRSLDAASLLLSPLSSIDGYILPNDDILDLTDSINELNANKIMIGTTSIDGLWSWPFYNTLSTPIDDNELKQYLNAYFESQSQTDIDNILSIYYNSDNFTSFDIFNEYQILWMIMSADGCLVCPSFNFINHLLSSPSIFNGDLYLYQFLGSTEPYYATHASELGFVFGINTASFFSLTWDQTLSNSMNNLWSNFVKDQHDNNLISYNFNDTGIIFGGRNSLEIKDKYYDKYRNGFCQFISDQSDSKQILQHLCYQDIMVDITTSNPSYPTELPTIQPSMLPTINPSNTPTLNTNKPTDTPAYSPSDFETTIENEDKTTQSTTIITDSSIMTSDMLIFLLLNVYIVLLCQ